MIEKELELNEELGKALKLTAAMMSQLGNLVVSKALQLKDKKENVISCVVMHVPSKIAIVFEFNKHKMVEGSQHAIESFAKDVFKQQFILKEIYDLPAITHCSISFPSTFYVDEEADELNKLILRSSIVAKVFNGKWEDEELPSGTLYRI